MTDCKICRLRLETLGNTMEPFCANEECSLYNNKLMQIAKKKFRSQR